MFLARKRFLSHWLTALTLSMSLLFAAKRARADGEPVLDPRIAITSDALEPPLSARAPAMDERLLRRDLRRSRALLMVGGGLLAASVAHVAAFTRPIYCYDHPPDDRITPTTPLYAGSAMAAISIGLLIAGGVKLAQVPHAYRSQHRGRDRVAYLALGAVASAVVGSAVLAATHLADRMRCINP